MPLPRLGNIKAVLNTVDLDPKIIQKLESITTAKPYLSEYIGRIDEAVKSPEIGLKYKSRLNSIWTAQETNIRQLYTDIDSELKTRDLTDRLSVKGLDDKQNLRNAKVFVKQSLRHFEHTFKQGFRRYEQSILTGLKENGLETVEAFRMLLKAPRKFEQLYGASQDEIIEAIFDRSISTPKPIVNNITKVLIDNDQNLIKELQKSGSAIGLQGNYFLPFTIKPDIVALHGEAFMAKILADTTTLKAEGITNLIKELTEAKDFTFNTKPMAVLQQQSVTFKNGAAMLEFFKAIETKDFRYNLLNEYFMHKQRVLRIANLQAILGTDPVKVLGGAIEQSRLRLGKKFDLNLNHKYEALANSINLKLNVATGKRFIDDQFWYGISTAVNQILSLVTAAPARSTIRNLFIDYEANALSVGTSLYNPDFKMGQTAKRIFKSMSYLLTQALGDSTSKAAVNNILDIAGWANSLDGLTQSNILSFEDVLDTSNVSNRTTAASQLLVDKLATAQDALFKWSGNHSLIDFVRARRFTSIQQLMTNVLNHRTYNGWLSSLDELGKKQADFLRTNFGLDKDTYNFLKQVKKVRPEISNKSYNKLGFSHIPEFISRESILDTSDAVAAKFARFNETASQFKERTASNWQRFIYNATTAAAPVPTIADSLTAPLFSNIPTWLSIFLRPFMKFADVAFAQQVDLAEQLAVAIYGRPKQFIGWDKSLVAWGKGLALYTAYGAAAIWAKDLFNNKKPTNFKDPKNAIRLVAISGFGGFHNMAASHFIGAFPNPGGTLYGATPLGSAYSDASRLKKALGSRDNKVGKTALALHSANPFSQLWYASGAVEYGINQILMDRFGKEERAINLERYGKPYLFE